MYKTTKALAELPADLPIMLKVSDAASILAVSGKHVRDLINENQIHAVKVGTAWRIPRDKFLTQFELA